MSLDYSKYKNDIPLTERTRQEHWDNEIKLTMQFWADICEEYGITPEHPKYQKLAGMAWEHGHSAGYSEIEYYFSEFIQLVDL